MNQPLSENVASPRDPGFLRLAAHVFLLTVFICSAFGALASGAVCLILVRYGNWEGTRFAFKAALKLAGFACLTGACGWLLIRPPRRESQGTGPLGAPPGPADPKHTLALCGALALIVALVMPRLNEYPWAAPDETHHLIVARNLAEYGLYASGQPETGFKVFDSYDSVGAPVIAPVAAMFRFWGSTLGAARLVMAAYFLGLCGAAYLLLANVFDAGAAIAGVLVMAMGFGSVYLGRTLYGEVPALAFLLTGLLLWRRAIQGPKPGRDGFLAGVLFGLMVLCKSIAVLSAFAFLGAAIYDALSYRRIKWAHLTAPALGGILAIGLWWLIKALAQQDVQAAAAGTLSEYRHNLMFGLRCARQGLGWMLREPFTVAGLTCAMVWVLPLIFAKRYDPPSVVLFFMALFYAYWWLFFTPGHIPRYMWFTYAIAGLFAGAMAWSALRLALHRGTGLGMRLVCAAGVLLVVGPAVARTAETAGYVRTCDEMRDDYAVAQFVAGLPPETPVATTYWPLERTVNFVAHRAITSIDAIPGQFEPRAVTIVDARTQPCLTKDRLPMFRAGRYAILAPEH